MLCTGIRLAVSLTALLGTIPTLLMYCMATLLGRLRFAPAAMHRLSKTKLPA